MLSSIFIKTIYEKRWSTFAWSLAMILFTWMVVALFPTFQESFGKSLQDVPESLKAFLGEASDYQQITGFVDLQVLTQMIWLTVIHGVILCTGLIAGEESEGTLQSLLAQPVSRTKVYVEKLLASIVIVGIVCISMGITIYVSALLINENIGVWPLLQATFSFWLTTIFLSLLSYAIGAATGRRGLAGAIVGLFGFAAFMVSSLAQTVTWLKPVNLISPFKYFNTPSVLENGLQLNNVAVLSGACVAFALVGWFVFIKRDIFAR